jgi:hypothetical protein
VKGSTFPGVQYDLPDFGNIDDPSLEPIVPSADRTGRLRKARRQAGVAFRPQ